MIMINIDGPDGVGKTSTVEQLVKDLQEVGGYKVKHVHFPRYETELGKVINEVLWGRIKMDPLALQMLYCADRINFCKYELPTLYEQEYDILIVDRYHTSGIVYGQLDGISVKQIVGLQEQIIEPDLNLILNCSFNILLQRVGNRKEKDMYETESNLVRQSNKYLDINEHVDNVVFIDASRELSKVVGECYYLIKNKLQ